MAYDDGLQFALFAQSEASACPSQGGGPGQQGETKKGQSQGLRGRSRLAYKMLTNADPDRCVLNEVQVPPTIRVRRAHAKCGLSVFNVVMTSS